MAIQPAYSPSLNGQEPVRKNVNAVRKCIWVPGAVIIGAGPSGLAVAACLRKQGVPFLILEKEGCIGSLWKFKTYNSLQLHLPKRFCELPHMQFPSEFPAYPDKKLFLNYLESYAKEFSIQPLFKQEVRSVVCDEKVGPWRVETNESEFLCRWLIVATGENAEPVTPDISGISDYSGRMIHSCSYKDGTEFKGNRVLVVGCGNSGMEVGLDLCQNGALVSLVVRDKLHILPREIMGRSTFGLAMLLLKWFSVKQVDRLLLLYSRLVLGATESLGIKRPELGPLELKNLSGKTPVLDTGTFSKIKSGDIKVVRGIKKFTSSGAQFVDDTTEDFDTVILATGYRSNVTSWLKADRFFDPNEDDPFPNHWKGQNGIYCVGFSKKGLFGTSIDAQKVAQDIATQWMSESRHVSH